MATRPKIGLIPKNGADDDEQRARRSEKVGNGPGTAGALRRDEQRRAGHGDGDVRPLHPGGSRAEPLGHRLEPERHLVPAGQLPPKRVVHGPELLRGRRLLLRQPPEPDPDRDLERHGLEHRPQPGRLALGGQCTLRRLVHQPELLRGRRLPVQRQYQPDARRDLERLCLVHRFEPEPREPGQ